MTFTSKKLGADSIQLTIELSKEDLSHHVTRAEDSLGRDLEIDGFRKGKAPREKVRKEVGEARIMEAALELAIQRSLGQVISDEDLNVIETSDLKILENTKDKLVYSVVVQLFPEVKLPKLDTISISRQEVKVEDKEISDTIESIRSSRAILSDKDAPAAQGDRVEVDFEVSEDGAVIEGGLSKNHPVVIGAKNFVPGFEDQLIGMKKDDQKEFSLTAPNDFANKSVAGKKLDFKVTMHNVKSVTLPEVNDDFAKTLGKFQTVIDLKNSIEQGLLQEKKDKETDRVRTAALDKILSATSCTASPTMVDRQLDLMIQSFDQDLHQQDMELSMYLAKLEKTQDDLRREWRGQAERQVKQSLILHTIAKENNISVTPEETQEAVGAILQTAIAKGQAGLDPERLRQNVESRLLNEKTFEFVEKMCVK